MWPRSEERGNPPPSAVIDGRVMEASMWPRSEERGNLPVRLELGKPSKASMWPRSEERGNVECERAMQRNDHCFNVAALRGARKCNRRGHKRGGHKRLQCGRAPRSAEIWHTNS